MVVQRPAVPYVVGGSSQMQPVYMYKYSINFTQLILLNSALKVQIGGAIELGLDRDFSSNSGLNQQRRDLVATSEITFNLYNMKYLDSGLVFRFWACMHGKM